MQPTPTHPTNTPTPAPNNYNPNPNQQDRRWGKATCSDCKSEREPTSTYYSYCIGCGRARQRRRYRTVRAAAGLTVVPRIEDTASVDRRAFLLRSSNKPGPCELCGQPEPDGLKLLYEGDPTDDPISPNNKADLPQPYAVACRDCYRLLHDVTALELRKLVLIAHYLDKRRTPRERILPDLDNEWRPVGKAYGPEKL